MNPFQFVLSLIRAYGGKVQGRTLLQKTGYFVSILSGFEPELLQYRAHYYGPYSAIVDSTVTQLKNLGFVEEASTGFGVLSGGFEVRRYDYSLTKDGEEICKPLISKPEYAAIEKAIQTINQAGQPDYMELSIAAKAYYILRKRGNPMTRHEVVEEAQKFNWNISDQSLNRAVTLLQHVQLAE